MQKSRSIAKIYLHQAAFTKWDVIFTLITAIFAILLFVSLWFAIPLLAAFCCLLISRSAHVSDREYEQLLSHLLAFNTVREAREEGYEELYQFFIVGYHEKKNYVDFYIQGYDLGKGTVRCGDDKTLRSGYYTLSHLHFTETDCLIYTLEADIVGNTVTSEKRIVSRSAAYQITTKIIEVRGTEKSISYLSLPYCSPIPVHIDTAELEEILTFFQTK